MPRRSTPPILATRADVLRAAERLQRAAELLRQHARRCTEDAAPAHGRALHMARGMVRAVVVTEDGV